ncbi:CDP-diacylglycerol--glycerol-3-phosphate 3-phosphatidyltransferase [Actinorhabdospora filicis]|uniref:Phosphatidylinositol phosphate synthase n=1 Tax=Actinorhabdospora filicis TaxID=1785913 RepID=A0A9W6W7G2_9ACTN|nr:CDP-alcohol phosphatidyltransferase family protein [Actinorhabdospora filicis]GLZ75456.1 CDP-diacylglycerol--glycerol-3-phosphate 3-phosphatidyltransferase [Actinorhabdospora filicis]
MAKSFSGFGRAQLARFLDPLGRYLVRAGVSPNAVTLLGTLGVIAGCVFLVARGYLLSGLAVVTVSACTDMVDGAMARVKGVTNRFGAFLDSTMDRVADGAIFGALAYWAATTGQPRAAAAALLCLVLAQVVSYAKARAEGLGADCSVGLAERPERLVLIGIGTLLGGLEVPYALEAVLWLLAVLSAITVVQRVLHVRAQLVREGSHR